MRSEIQTVSGPNNLVTTEDVERMKAMLNARGKFIGQKINELKSLLHRDIENLERMNSLLQRWINMRSRRLQPLQVTLERTQDVNPRVSLSQPTSRIGELYQPTSRISEVPLRDIASVPIPRFSELPLRDISYTVSSVPTPEHSGATLPRMSLGDQYWQNIIDELQSESCFRIHQNNVNLQFKISRLERGIDDYPRLTDESYNYPMGGTLSVTDNYPRGAQSTDPQPEITPQALSYRPLSGTMKNRVKLQRKYKLKSRASFKKFSEVKRQ